MNLAKQRITLLIFILATLLATSFAFALTLTPALANHEASQDCLAQFGGPTNDASACQNASADDCNSLYGGITGNPLLLQGCLQHSSAAGGAGGGPGTVPMLEPVNNEALGTTYDCNGVPISVDVECTGGDNPILSYLGGVINFLAAGVGVVVVAMVTLAGAQYITSHGDPQKVGAAKSRLVNALIGLISFIFLYAFLQWLLPGGAFNGGDSGSQNTCQPTPGGGVQPC